MPKRGGLGRGLSALIPGAPEAGDASTGLLEVPANADLTQPEAAEEPVRRRDPR